MIRAVSIYDFYDNPLFYTNFARFDLSYVAAMRTILDVKEHLIKNLEHITIGRYRIGIMLEPDYTISVLADRTNKEEEIEGFLRGVWKILKDNFGDNITPESLSDTEKQEKLEEFLEKQIKRIPVKITFVGSGGVGKTTMINLLAKGIITRDYKPTLLADVEKLEFSLGAFGISLFSVAGQPGYRKTWDIVSEATDIVILVLDSTQENIRETKIEVLPKIRKLAPYARYVAIANKQDLPTALPPATIEEEIGLPTFGMVATKEDSRQKLLAILQEIIQTIP
ncbi:MAG: ADP-ribosylation factor-like protein [Candidatus Njordarchaeales archaeon]